MASSGARFAALPVSREREASPGTALESRQSLSALKAVTAHASVAPANTSMTASPLK